MKTAFLVKQDTAELKIVLVVIQFVARFPPQLSLYLSNLKGITLGQISTL